MSTINSTEMSAIILENLSNIISVKNLYHELCWLFFLFFFMCCAYKLFVCLQMKDKYWSYNRIKGYSH